MKKIAFVSLVALSALFVFVLVMNPQTVNGSKKNTTAGPGTALPDSVNKIIQRACMDCHSDDGNFMAKGKVNFSGWDKYDSEKQFNKANTICKELTKSAMPPKKWRANNPSDVPTQAEVDLICKWAKSLQK
ncbi:MAG: heme-binding domain-containing protein [Bacteroidales bacterium]